MQISNTLELNNVGRSHTYPLQPFQNSIGGFRKAERGFITMENRFKEKFFDNKKTYGMVIDFFDWILRGDDFKYILKNFTEDCGFGSDSGGITFPSSWHEEDDDEEDDENYFTDGVMIFERNAEIIIDNSMYIKCLELACEIYMEEHGEDEEVKRNLQIIKDRYADK